MVPAVRLINARTAQTCAIHRLKIGTQTDPRVPGSGHSPMAAVLVAPHRYQTSAPACCSWQHFPSGSPKVSRGTVLNAQLAPGLIPQCLVKTQGWVQPAPPAPSLVCRVLLQSWEQLSHTPGCCSPSPASRPSLPGKRKGPGTASAAQIKASASKETIKQGRAAFKGGWAPGQREFIFHRFLLKGKKPCQPLLALPASGRKQSGGDPGRAPWPGRDGRGGKGRGEPS